MNESLRILGPALLFLSLVRCGDSGAASGGGGGDGSGAGTPTSCSSGGAGTGAGDTGGTGAVGGGGSGTGGSGGAPTLIDPVEQAEIDPFVSDCVSAPDGYGAYGDVTAYDRFEIENPAWVGAQPLPAQVLVPQGGAEPHPLIVYAHPFGGSDWTRARAFLEHVVSRDHVVVFVPYPTAGATVCERYDTLWGGVTSAVAALEAQANIDTSRIGIIGHSFGGGASSWLAQQAVAEGWGSNGSFVYANAPWYTHRMETAGWSTLAGMRLLLMGFADDDTNDPRIAITQQWNNWEGARKYVTLQSGEDGAGCSQTADHVVPATGGGGGAVALNGLDTWGTWRHAALMAACALRGEADACAIVDGPTQAETSMGTWLVDDAEVPPALGTDDPAATVTVGPNYTFSVEDTFPCDGNGPNP